MSQNIYLHVSQDDFTDYHLHIVKQPQPQLQTSRSNQSSHFVPPPSFTSMNNIPANSIGTTEIASVYTVRNNRNGNNLPSTEVSSSSQSPGSGSIGIATATIPLSSFAPGLLHTAVNNNTASSISTERTSPIHTQDPSTSTNQRLYTTPVPRNTYLNNIVDMAFQNIFNDLTTQNVEFTFNVEDDDPNRAANVQDINANSDLYVFTIEEEEEEENLECTICQSEFQKNDIVRKLKCNHHFHVSCIDKWFETHSTCPTCRQQINGETST